MLEHDRAADETSSTRWERLGAEQFDRFFEKYELKLGIEYGGKGRTPVDATSVVRELDQYCRNTIQC